MKRYIIAWMLLLWAVCAWSSGISLISESMDELIVEFALPDYTLEHSRDGNGTWQKIASDYGAVDAEEGHPLLRTYSEAIAIPVDGDISIQILDSRHSSLRNINLYPAARMVLDDWDVDYEFYQNPRVYNSDQLYPAVIVEKGEPAFIGNRRFIPLHIRPFQYRALSQELIVHNYIRLRISISGDKNSPKNWQLAKNPLDGAADAFFLNNATSQSWRLEKTRDHSYEAPQYRGNIVSRIQLLVDKDGIYRVNKAFLQGIIDAEVDTLGVTMAWDLNTLDPRRLELLDKNGNVPIHFVGEEDGSFDDDDYFEFYGRRNPGKEGYMDSYTQENVYTLYLKDSLGARMAVENGGLIESNTARYIVPDAYEHTEHFEQQLVYDKLGHGWITDQNYFKEDNWFWRRISAPNLDIIPIQLQYPIDATTRTASAKVVLHGLTYSDSVLPGQWDHEASIRLNQAMINTHTWTGQTEQVFENSRPIPNTFLYHGTNNVYISLSGNTVMGDKEQVLLDYIDIKYWREYRTNNDLIKFTKPSNRPGALYQFEIGGFSTNDVSVYKIGSSVFNNLQIESFDPEGTGPWTVTMQDSVASTAIEYYACTQKQKMRPIMGRLDVPSDLKNPNNQADLVIITRWDMIDSEGGIRIKELYETKGYSVMMVDYQDIFDEFNHGIRHAQPLKDFLKYAYNNWAEPQLSHVLLLGEGTDDERDNSRSRVYNTIPVKKIWTHKHGATASDNWYACIVGEDTLPDIAISRINVWRPDQILPVAEKMESYHYNALANRLWNSHLTFTSGGKITDPDDIFAQQSEKIKRRCIPEDYRVTRVYTSTQSTSTDYFGGTFALKDAINSGTQFVQFLGHGGGRVWADYNLFNFNDVATLNNQTYPVFLSLACYASAFDTNGAASISEALIMQPNKGAIATLGFSGLGYLHQDEDWGLAFNEAVYQHDFDTLGIAMQYALARFYSFTNSVIVRQALTDGYAFLGDVALKMSKPRNEAIVNIDRHYYDQGDTLYVQANFPPEVTAARLYIMKDNEKVINVPYDIPVINGNFNANYVIPTSSATGFSRGIFVAGYSNEHEYVGQSSFAVGRPAVFHHLLQPAEPTWQDSVKFVAKAFSPAPIISMTCNLQLNPDVSNNPWINIPMELLDEDSNTWITSHAQAPRPTGREIFYRYTIVTTEGSFESVRKSLVFAGPELALEDIKLERIENEFVIKVLVSNIGNAASINTPLRLMVRIDGGSNQVFSTQTLGPLDINESRWETIPLTGLASGNILFQVDVNYNMTFSEWQYNNSINNTITLTVPFNYHLVGVEGMAIPSVDSNVLCEIPANLVPTGTEALFHVSEFGILEASNQPDIHPIALRSVDSGHTQMRSTAYEIKTLNSALVDSSDVFVSGKMIKLHFFYSEDDEAAQQYENENSYKIYRWDARGSKWILQGGNISTSENKVVFEVNRQGLYTIYRNRDLIRPTIDVNVQDQEFTVGGYVSGSGVISLMLSDANGIDVFDDSIRLYLNGTEVPEEDYVTAINLDNINRIPIKYQLSLRKGNYTLVVDCRDVNGNFNTREIQFVVNETFDITRIGNYPNPVLGRAEDPKNDGRTRFTYVLTDDADNVTIKVYTVAGRLVKTFDFLPTGVGYHEFPRTLYGWDCTDEQGFPLANGMYFYKVIARKGKKTIEKTMKMAILK
ncbi:MAG: hypothetical protein GX294_02080 [Candidatus Cloacimonetes bacterium]|nr:hypothetical protein [Candidatus Cloacimonadota bacterium]